MDWIMLDNCVKPITENRRQTPSHLAPIRPAISEKMRSFVTSPMTPNAHMSRRSNAQNRQIPGNYSLVNPSKEGSIDLQVKINQQTLSQLAQM